jgi:hypothetical protein
MDPSGYAGAQDLSLCQECAVDAAFILPADARPGEQLMLAGRLAVCGFWDMRPAFSTHLSVH